MAVAPKKPTQKNPPKGVKPGVNYYWNGREWVYIQQTKPKPAPKPTPKPTAPVKPTVTTSSWAETEAQRIVDQQLAAIEEQQKAWQEGLQAEAARKAQQAQAFAQMVQKMGIDKTIAGLFQSAGQDVSGYAKGFSGDVRTMADADAANVNNMLSGTGQVARNEGEDMANVTYGVGGWIPSKNLAEQGSAFAADAALQPGFMLQQALAKAQDEYNQASSQNPFLDAIMQVKLGKNDLVTSLRSERTELNFKQQEMKLKQIENERDYWLKMQAFYLSQKKYKLAAQAEKRARQTETRYANETAGRDAFGEVSPDYYEDGKGRIVPKGYKYNNQGILVKQATAGTKKDKSQSGLTANEQQAQLEKTYKAEDDIKDLALKLAKEYHWTPSAGEATSRAIRNKIAAAIRQRYGWVTTTASKKALAQIIGRVLTELSKIGPPAPGADAGSSGSGMFD